jgi:hypothetical protein
MLAYHFWAITQEEATSWFTTDRGASVAFVRHCAETGKLNPKTSAHKSTRSISTSFHTLGQNKAEVKLSDPSVHERSLCMQTKDSALWFLLSLTLDALNDGHNLIGTTPDTMAFLRQGTLDNAIGYLVRACEFHVRFASWNLEDFQLFHFGGDDPAQMYSYKCALEYYLEAQRLLRGFGYTLENTK